MNEGDKVSMTITADRVILVCILVVRLDAYMRCLGHRALLVFRTLRR